MLRRSLLLLLIVVAASCATYHQKNWNFNSEFQRGDLQSALGTLQKNKDEANGRSKFIYHVNNGLLLSILGDYEKSNEYFEKAFLFGEDYHVNYVYEAASYFTNPMVATYRGEDHEHLMLLYFKAINYLKMNKPEDALVECRRLNIRLNQLSDKYSSDKKYKRDAFIHTLMGIIYQANKDYNNAFIAYRNALDIYENDYSNLFQVPVPEQLKKDLLNTARWTGLEDEYAFYKEKFGVVDHTSQLPDTDLIFFWHNGLAPVKDEWSLTFLIDHNQGNAVAFTNTELGLTFPFPVEQEKKTDLKKIEVVRVAFPKYVQRPTYYSTAHITYDNQTYPLELSEDINKIAFHCLHERMTIELSKGLLRLALKKATEHSIRKDDERLGALIGVVNALTEKADTRNWQTLPHSIYYTRIPLKEGTNEITFTLNGTGEVKNDYAFTYQAEKGKTLFHTFSSLESTHVSY